jgi:putative membrane protein
MVRTNKINNRAGNMRAFLRLGKLLALLFWALVLVNLLDSFTQPFALLLHVAGALVLLIHGLELLLFKARLQQRPQPGLERLQVLLFGVFHVFGLPPLTQAEVEHA